MEHNTERMMNMDYDAFKVQLTAMLADGMTVRQVAACLDALSASYEIRRKEQRPQDADALSLFLAAKDVEEKSCRTLKLYRSVLSRFLRAVGRPIHAISTNDVRLYLSACKQSGYKNTTIGGTRRIINGFFEWCVLEGVCAVNPVKRIAAIKQEKSPRKAMKRIELEYLRNACNTLRDKALVDFLYSTGVRVSECCAARIDHIDWEQKTVLIEHGKGDVTRLTYLNPEAEVSLRAYLASRADDSPYIFARTRGRSAESLNAKTVQNAIDRIASQSGRAFSVRITPHVFRHTIATVLLRNGMPVEQVQRFLGHAKIDTTLIYAEIRDDDVRRSHSLYAA